MQDSAQHEPDGPEADSFFDWSVFEDDSLTTLTVEDPEKRDRSVNSEEWGWRFLWSDRKNS